MIGIQVVLEALAMLIGYCSNQNLDDSSNQVVNIEKWIIQILIEASIIID